MHPFVLKTAAETKRFGQILGSLLQSGDIVALLGDLGAGKTTLTQSIARALGYRGVVTSPTFALIHEYRGPIPIVHIDPYRLEQPTDIVDLGLDAYWESDAVLIIEWADRLEGLLPEEHLLLRLAILDDANATEEEAPRQLTLIPNGLRYENLATELAELFETDGQAIDGIVP